MLDKGYNLYIFLRNLLADGVAILYLRGDFCPDERQSVLVIRLDSIGDYILWLDSATAIRQLFPPNHYRLVLFGNAAWRELAEITTLFDDCYFVEKKRFNLDLRYRFNIWKTLRKNKWAVAIHPTFSRDIDCGDAVVRVSGAGERIGSNGDLSNQFVWQRWISNRWYTRLVPTSAEPLMELERNAEFIRHLGGNDFKAGLPNLKICAELPPKFEACGYVVLVPGGSLALKQWPVEKFAELSVHIHKQFGAKIIVCGSKGETVLGANLLDLVENGEAGWAEDWTGKTSLVELSMIIKGAKLLIGNDSSAVHIAAAVGTPSLCIVGGGHFGRFVPYRYEKVTSRPVPVVVFHHMECYGCNLKCTKVQDTTAAGTCISSVTVEEVWEKFLELVTDLKW